MYNFQPLIDAASFWIYVNAIQPFLNGLTAIIIIGIIIYFGYKLILKVNRLK
jgi:hypothetical protein